MISLRSGPAALVGSSLIVAWVGAFIFGYPGVLGPHWQETFQVGRGDVGASLFFVLAAVGLFMFIAGRLQERFGIRAMMVVGVVACGLDVLALPYASDIRFVWGWAFVMGAASCFMYLPALTTVQRWYPQKRGLMSGVVNFTFGFSTAVMSPLFGLMFRTVGYESMNLILGAAVLASGLVAAPFTGVPRDAVSGAGLQPRHFPVPPTARSLSAPEAVRTANFRWLWLVWALQGSAGISMVTLSTQFGLSRGMTLASAVVILTAFSVTNGLGRLVMGWLSDHVGRRRAMSAAFAAAGIAYYLLPHTLGIADAALLAAVIGFAFGTLFAVSAPLAIDCFGIQNFGSIYGLIFTGYGFVAGFLGPYVAGRVLDATSGNFTVVFMYLGTYCFAGASLIHLVNPRRGRVG
jgi:MFS transporter, OFA family, oxalate/formate antiporter